MKGALPATAAVAFAATALLRYLDLNGFPNDQFMHLAGAQQVLMGEWPTRDFFDPGLPLMYVMSAGAQLLLGRTLFAEAILVAGAFGITAACTLVAAARLSRSLVIGVFATAASIAIFPRAYSYPKVLLYAAMPLAMGMWTRKPTVRHLLWPAALVAAAFLFRHDHGLYLGAAAVVATALAPADRWKQRLTRTGTLCALVALAVAPYLVYVEVYDGLGNYVRDGIEFSRREADRTQLRLAGIGSGHDAFLFYGFHALPLIALAWASIDRLRSQLTDTADVASLAVMAMATNVGFLRDPLSARLPDAIVPAVLLSAWLAGRAWRVSAWPLRAFAMTATSIVAALGAIAVGAVGETASHIERTDLSLGLARVPDVIRQRTEDLTARFSLKQLPDSGLPRLFPFFGYLDRCTTDRQRLLFVGNAPEVFVYARRMFAGGQSSFIEGYYQSEDNQRKVIERMRRQVVQFVLMPTGMEAVWRDRPYVRAFVDAQFRPMAEIVVDESRTIRVLFNAGFPPERYDPETGWPCYL